MNNSDIVFLKVNTKLNNRYRIESVLGVGGFGITYLAFDELLNVRVAIKEYFPQGIVTRNSGYSDNVSISYATQQDSFEQGKKRFVKEARLAAQFQHSKGVVHVTDYFEANNTAYIVMDYLDGITLKKYLEDYGPIPMADMLELIVPLLESLDDIHRAGLIHRDISPDNIMVKEGGIVTLMDFGAAREYIEYGGRSLSVILKHGYAPAEQYQSRGIQGPWTDIYALCATIYRSITGMIPQDSIERVMDDRLLPPSRLGVAITPRQERTLMKGLSVKAIDRYQNLKDFCDDLYGIDGAEPDSGTTSRGSNPKDTKPKDGRNKDEGVDVQKKPPSPPKKILVAVLIAIVVLAGIGIGTGAFLIKSKSINRTVPNLVNLPLEEAKEIAAGDDNSLIVVQKDEQYSSSVEEGFVIDQSVKPGTVMKKGAQVEVTVSKGPEPESPDNPEVGGTTPPSGNGNTGTDDTEILAMQKARQHEKDMVFGPVAYNDHAYGVFDMTKIKHVETVKDCNTFCIGAGGYMAAINDEEENNFLFNFVKEHDTDDGRPNTFFGYTDEKHEGKWRWISGSSSKYENWNKRKDGDLKKQPNSAKDSEDCAQFYGDANDGTWNDAELGSNSHYFLCEWNSKN